ncbi:MAG TPA: hypothetical protein VGP76_20685 [Planctomycetaceae bacterium]|nr:hypothetical protein [Planctomycetaceae bacterium]
MSDKPNPNTRQRSRLSLMMAFIVLLPAMYLLAEGPAFAIAEFNPATERAIKPTLCVVYQPLSWTCTTIDRRISWRSVIGYGPAWTIFRTYEKSWRDVRDAVFRR